VELLFVCLGGALIGFVLHAALPARDTRGVLLVPGVATIVAAVAWELLLQLGWRADGGWIWVVSLALPAAAGVLVARGLVARRRRADSELYDRVVAGA
jgi:hypothetical protein